MLLELSFHRKTARLQKVLPSVLHEDQTCGVPGRSIVSNLNLIRDLIEYCSITDDQYKAKWVYLARYFIGCDLGRLHEPWDFLKSHIKPRTWSAPSYYQSVVSAAKDIKDVFTTFVGKTLAVRVIYAELLIVSRVRVRSRTLWQDKLGRTIPWSKVYLHSYKGVSMNQEHNVPSMYPQNRLN